ncbi:hypothetical protein L218DRAFT_498864 [Marasmius fiardii PR-910]|nr:hypothetical protein L218DRAFT_498864 [Marasmius fiardii PR-910]
MRYRKYTYTSGMAHWLSTRNFGRLRPIHSPANREPYIKWRTNPKKLSTTFAIMPEGYAQNLGAGLALLNLFGLSTTAARVCAVIIIAFLAACLLLRYRYPCLSPSSLRHAIEEARRLFDKCNTTGAFIEGEEASFGLSSANYRSCFGSRVQSTDRRSDLRWKGFVLVEQTQRYC